MALNTANAAATFDETVKNLQEQPGAAWRFVLGWMQAWLHKQADNAVTPNTLTPYAEEAAARLLVETGGLKLFVLAGYYMADDERLARAPGRLSGVIGAAPAPLDV